MFRLSVDLGVAQGVNWLAIATLASSVSTPLIVAVVGYFIQKAIRATERRDQTNRDLVAARIARFDNMSNLLNDIFCYCAYVGHWRELLPHEILERKRELDKLVFASTPLWSEAFGVAYREFMDACFVTGGAPSARIRANVKRHCEVHQGAWRSEWSKLFISPYEGAGESKPPSHRLTVVQPAYATLLSAIGRDLGSNLEHGGVSRMWAK